MEKVIEKQTAKISDEKIDNWFNDIVATIRTHQLMLNTCIADKEVKSLYSILMSGNQDQISDLSHKMTSKHFITKMTYDFAIELKLRKVNLIELALNNSNSGILVWAVINDDDEKSEDDLIMSIAKINGKYYDYGFTISPTILEKSDNHPVPKHYKSILNG